jgi:hypothetical protein
MKKRFILTTGLSIVLSSQLFGLEFCNNEFDTNSLLFETENICKNISSAKVEFRTEDERYSITAEYPISTCSRDLDIYIDTFIRNYFFPNSYDKTSSLQQLFNKESKKFVEQMVEGMTVDLTIEIIYKDNSLIQLSFSHYYYAEGAAHSLFSTTYKIFDLKTLNVLTLNDIIQNDKFYQFVEIAEKEFRKQLKVQTFGDEFILSKEFFISKESLNFVYAPYEIASFAAGEIEFTVPFSKIKNLTTTYFNNLFPH